MQEIDHLTTAFQQASFSETNDFGPQPTSVESTSPLDYALEGGACRARNVDILLVPGFSLVTLGSIVEPLCAANGMSDRCRFNLRLVAAEPGDVPASSGLGICGTVAVSDLVRDITFGMTPDLLIICSGTGVPTRFQRGFVDLLRNCKRQNVAMAGMGNAAWLLADAGVLPDGTCALHWKSRAAFLERHHDVAADNVLFVNDGPVSCCGGELAAFDFIVDYIVETCGPMTARRICQHFLMGHWRGGDTRQPSPGNHFANCNHHLDRMVELMAQNLEEPLSIDEIAETVSLSRRQIERIFSKHASTTPSRFYKSLRMEKAQQLIEQTSMSVIEIAFACGFASASHFTACFKSRFGVGPFQLRKMRTEGRPKLGGLV